MAPLQSLWHFNPRQIKGAGEYFSWIRLAEEITKFIDMFTKAASHPDLLGGQPFLCELICVSDGLLAAKQQATSRIITA